MGKGFNFAASVITSVVLTGPQLAGIGGSEARAGVVVGYEASSGVTPQTPDWALIADTAMTNDGTVLKQATPAGTNSAYRSIDTAGLMVNGVSNYTVQFGVKLVADTPANDWYTNVFLVWSDNTAAYGLTLVKNADGPGTGGIKTGSGTTVGNLANVVTGIDWSASHDFSIAYTGATNSFNVFVDGALATTVAAGGLQIGAYESYWADRIVFGDYLNGASSNGPTAVDWSYVRLLDNAVTAAVPEPASLGLFAAAAGLAMGRRRKAM